jgi:SAM-dependent methyltransferase
MYTGFAEVYDGLMSDVDYPAWAAFYTELLRRRGITGGTLCECACGTGGLTLPLAEAGWQVTGVDLSREMLDRAQGKARERGLPVRFVCQDMRRLELHHPVDAVLATCDGVNYLLKGPDLTAFLRAAWTALRPGGCLAFDVSTPHKLWNILGDNLLAEDTGEVTYLWQNLARPRQHTVDLHLCIFIREEDGRYRRLDEEQTQRAWTREELTGALEHTGFRDIAFHGDRRTAPPRSDEKRWHVTAVKPAEG